MRPRCTSSVSNRREARLSRWCRAVKTPSGMVDAVIAQADAGIININSRIVARLETFAEASFLVSDGPDSVALGARAAEYVNRNLHGTRPADLPLAWLCQRMWRPR